MSTKVFVEDFNKNNTSSDILRKIKSSFWIFIISPIFLFTSLMIYFFIPEKLFKINLRDAIRKTLHNYIKRFITVLGAIIFLILTFPLFIIIPILIKLDSKGPVFYKQVRVGMNRRRCERRNQIFDNSNEQRNDDRRKAEKFGKLFNVLKFRTMFEDAEKKTGPVWAIEDDPRITKIGIVLRSWHLDELPQLLNIIFGDMRFIGPRPERPCFITEFAPKILGYEKRFSVKPGLTGWAQINCGYDQSIESVKRKLAFEVDYIDNKNSIAYDLKILFQTGRYLLTRKILFQNEDVKTI